MTQTITGSANNGHEADVAFSFFIGRIRVRLQEHGGEFAYPTYAAAPADPLQPLSGHVNSHPAAVTSLRKSTTTADMVVVRFRFLPEQQ